MDFILNTLLRGGSPTTITRNKDFASLFRKVTSMKKRVEDKNVERQSTEISSVGTVEAESESENMEEVSVSDSDSERVAI